MAAPARPTSCPPPQGILSPLVGKRVLLLQGPNGPFFARLAEELRARGSRVTKVNFNSGDDLFYRGGDLVRFNAPMATWPTFCRDLMVDRGIEAVVVYGDQRPIHRQAVAAARELELLVLALEEGYLRPDFVTIERDGANANSSLPKDPDFYRNAAAQLPEPPPAVPMGNTFRPHAWLTTFHSVAFTWLSHRYPHYQHHRDINCFKEAFFWSRSGIRKVWYARRERGELERLTGPGAPPFFLVPLQVHCDSQLQHSSYSSMGEFIDEVVASFAAHAAPDTQLVVKHHPHDRGYTDYTRRLERLAERHDLGERLHYVHDIHLPTLLKQARGVVTMNSTVGLSALHHRAPVKVLGRAVYDMPDLTSQRSLAEFFVDPGEVDRKLVHDFMAYLRATNQVNGSFYKRTPGFLECGLSPEALGEPARYDLLPHGPTNPRTTS
ncbi:MAG: capsular biosynthesis protein [Polyangiaceae bacterium]